MGDSPGAKSVVDWVEQIVGLHGDSVAATGVGETLTFTELWARSLRLARELVDHGVLPDDRVGLWAEQSSDLLIGMVGIMAAGAAYVPLDPGYPKGRLDRIVEDAGMSLIVAPGRHHAEAATVGVPLVATVFESGDDKASVHLPDVGPHSSAYVIFTSGSTGRPKGVVIEHGSVIDLLAWMIADCRLGPSDRIMGTASPAYDASVPTFLLPLVIGGTFIAMPLETSIDPVALAAFVAQYRPRALQTSPTMLRMLAETGWKGDKRLDVWTGGEQTAASAIRYVAPRVHELCNYYGPTEATVQISVARLGPEDTDGPCGTPGGHVECLVLTADGDLAAQGEVGELYITGSALARGYHNNPALTEERFREISPGGRLPARAYRTGDLARYRDDGALMILGRMDDQIKLRGYLVEPREVEVRLMEHPLITDAVVLAHADGDDDEPRLIAFITASGQVTARLVRSYARETLPDHMVPAALIVLEAFPLTPNGKVDRRALAEGATAALAAQATAIAPTDDREPTELETGILELFASVLAMNAASLSVDDDFFDIGGTSLRCARLFMGIEDRYGVELPMSTMVNASTARLLAVVIDEERAGGSWRTRPDPPRHEWERILGSLWEEVLGIQAVGRTDDFFDLGGTPEDATRVITQLKALYGVELTMRDLQSAPTVVALASLLGARSSHSCLVPLKPTGSNTPFFCIAGAGGLAVTFMPLARMLGPEQPFYGLQARGIERRAVPDYTLRRAAIRYAREIRSVQPHGPYLIGGHSLGGAIALKVVHLLEAAGEKVALLAVFDALLSEPMIGEHLPATKGTSGRTGRWSALPRRPRISTMLRLPLTGIVPLRGIAQFDVFAGLGQLQAAFASRLLPWRGTAIVFVSDDEESENVEVGWRYLLKGSWRCVAVPGEHITMLEKVNISVAARNLREQIALVLAPRADDAMSAAAQGDRAGTADSG